MFDHVGNLANWIWFDRWFSVYWCLLIFIIVFINTGDASHQGVSSLHEEICIKLFLYMWKQIMNPLSWPWFTLIFILWLLTGIWKFIFRDTSYVTIPLHNYQNPIPTILKYWDVPPRGWLLIYWSFAFTVCNITAVLQSTINHFILLFILWPFGTFFYQVSQTLWRTL